MVEISLSGSGEGPGGAIPRGYSTGPLRADGDRQMLTMLTKTLSAFKRYAQAQIRSAQSVASAARRAPPY
jgi:hypothetical protein